MASEHVLEPTDDNFDEEIINADVPALVDFWAEWCMPCKMLAPTIDELAADNAGKLKVGKVDTDAARNVAKKFGVNAIPTIVLIKDGQVAKKFVGLQQKADLQAAIDEVVG